MEESQFTHTDSLRLIEQMIHTAKREQKDDGKAWILWGWLLFLASVFSWFNMRAGWLQPFFFWNVFGVLSLVLLAWGIVRRFFGGRAPVVKTYTRDLYEKLNTGFFISLMLIIVSMNVGVHPRYGFALLLGLYGFWILIYGAVLNFKPSLIGAYITWAAAFVSLFATNLEHTMLLHALAVLCGYIIPGHMANNEFNKEKR
ncbi:MAG: hypothetical protein JWP27_730 [Flaviaesturariibacter sp.]|nr:hypothetical protein [Flaviaesturariibacter sp.]